MRRLCLLWLLMGMGMGAAHAQTPPVAPLPNMTTTQVTVSGLSSVAYMTVQFELAFSETVQGAGCKLHVAFQGCLQDLDHIGTTFVEHAGCNAWADSNKIVVLYPRASAICPYTNPNACWDWFSYDDPRFAQQSGHQMAAVKGMVDRLTGAAPATVLVRLGAP